jgi:rare lipoprotein A
MHPFKNQYQLVTIILTAALLVACGSSPKQSTSISSTSSTTKSSAATKPTTILPKAGSGRGGYYKDDGPGEEIPTGLELTIDAEPKVEPYSVAASRPYTVFGKRYTPIKEDKPFIQRGIGSWYGKKFHGQRTSNGEKYDMYKMTAAHPTLPLPSYARITNLSNGKQVIVRVNDRGPFHSSRIVDLSYTAALKLDYIHKGSSELLLERLLPADIEKMAENKNNRVTETVATKPVLNTPAVPTDDDGFEALVAANATPEPVIPPTVINPANKSPNNTNGFYLQFGAFGLRSNAEATFSRLQTQLTQLPTFEIVQQGMLYRLFSGPFSSHDEASHAQQLALNAGVPKPVIVQR